jgi:hypothetical protein
MTEVDDREAIAHLLGLWLAQPILEIDALVNRANVERIKRGLPTREIAQSRLRVIQGGASPGPIS